MEKNMNITIPVSLNSQNEIVDNGGSIVIPCITWAGDHLHIAKQREIGEFIVKCMNGQVVADMPLESKPDPLKSIVEGEKKAGRKLLLTDEVVNNIKALKEGGKTLKEICNEVGLSITTVMKAIKG
jgi:hypothetical protein